MTPSPPNMDGGGQERLLEILATTEKRGRPARQQNCVILFTDIVGFSTYASRHSDAEALALVQRFEGITRRQIGNHGGRVVMTAGDAVLACWDLTEQLTAAIQCAREFHWLLEKENREHRRADMLRVRTGIHYGSVMRLQDGDIIGHEVNMASRIQTAALPGEILISATVAAACSDGFDSQPAVGRLGLVRLKGLEKPAELFRVQKKGRRRVRQLTAGHFTSPFRSGNWRWSSWAILAIGLLLGASMLLSKPSSDFPNPAATASGFVILFAGWSLQWASYRPRTISFWHPLVRAACLFLWAGIVLPAGALLGCWPG